MGSLRIISLVGGVDETAEVEMLVRERMGEFVRKHRGDHGIGSAFDEYHALLAVIVERGGLFGEQVDGGFAKIEILGHEAEFLECQLFGADLLGFHATLQFRVEPLVPIGAGHGFGGDGVFDAEARDF